MTQHRDLEQLTIDTIRTLSIDMVEQANSGHPGMPLGAAPMAYELWTKFLKHNPSNPSWFNRDRFILSAGHGSPLLYSIMHLLGYDLSIEDLKSYRQWGSITHGHPEYWYPAGIEATTGPLGQGIGMAVGMAMAEAHLAKVYNRDQYEVVDHYTYVICGDGDLMEGVAAEAASLAGHLGLGKLIVLYDSNDICLDGDLDQAFTEKVSERFGAYGWQYLRVEDGNNPSAIGEKIKEAKADQDRPTLIEIKTVIGFGSPNKAGKSAAHGAPLGSKEAELTKETLGWEYPPFTVPDEVKTFGQTFVEKGIQEEEQWNQLVERYEQSYPKLAAQFKGVIAGELPDGWDELLPEFDSSSKALATREASEMALNALANRVPSLMGGSADLASSNKTHLKDYPIFSKTSYEGRNIWFGIREHAMGAALNGLSLHGGIRPYGATFFVFSDYLRPVFRLSAMMGQPVMYIFTHDSIAVGEDGPTHEPVEHLASLRAIPDLTVIRPADASETFAAYRYALSQSDGPVAFILSRQKLPHLTFDKANDGVTRGAYVLADPTDGKQAEIILIATGSEVSLAIEAHKTLAKEGISTRVVSMPSWELFEKQPVEYQKSVLPPSIPHRLAIEMAYPLGWERYTGSQGKIVGVTSYGASAPGEVVMEKYGFTVAHIVAEAKKLKVNES
ncbi:transketolase [Shimazuella sp. AN120528]|uniref:transketolase n=1 Tax=Shimazuella soli TaxID=1892854 RepID=UPI001F0D27CB|nr:transketolase [Shimazuella soli]MCH5586172.1 transketolase [Shimazuella soli]